MSNRDERNRADGASWALDRVAAIGLEAAKDEFRRRGMYGAPISTAVTNSMLSDFEKRTKKNCLASVLLLALGALHDEYGFGRDRLMKFMQKFDEGAAYLDSGEMMWEDLRKGLCEMYGIDIDALGLRKELEELED